MVRYDEGFPRGILWRVTSDLVVSGSVIQFHVNGHFTADVLDQAIPIWQEKFGYRVVTVSELMQLSGRELPPLPEAAP